MICGEQLAYGDEDIEIKILFTFKLTVQQCWTVYTNMQIKAFWHTGIACRQDN